MPKSTETSDSSSFAMKSESKLNVGVIGCGYWGPNLVRSFYRAKDIQVSVCDLDQGRLDKISSEYPHVRTVSDTDQLLDDPEIDAIVIATPAKTHFELGRRSLEQNKHALIEKPIASSSQEARELIRISQKKGKVLMAGHTFEYNPAVMRLKEYVQSGYLGKVYYAYSSRLNFGQIRDDVNAMWNLAPHDVSILLYLFGTFPLSVNAIGKSFIQEGIEDVVFITLEFPDNIVAHIHVSWLDPSKTRELTVVGDKRMVVYDDVDNEAKLKIYDKEVSRLNSENAYGEYLLKLRTGDIHIPRIDLSEPLRNECLHFVECIRENKKPKTDGENGYRVVRVLELAQQSLKKGGASVKAIL